MVLLPGVAKLSVMRGIFYSMLARLVSVVRSRGCPLFRGCCCIEVYGETFGTLESVFTWACRMCKV